jgi:hypothetical protein
MFTLKNGNETCRDILDTHIYLRKGGKVWCQRGPTCVQGKVFWLFGLLDISCDSCKWMGNAWSLRIRVCDFMHDFWLNQRTKQPIEMFHFLTTIFLSNTCRGSNLIILSIHVFLLTFLSCFIAFLLLCISLLVFSCMRCNSASYVLAMCEYARNTYTLVCTKSY